MKKIDAIMQKIKKKYHARRQVSREPEISPTETVAGEVSIINLAGNDKTICEERFNSYFNSFANERAHAQYIAAIYHLATNQLSTYNKLALAQLMEEQDECSTSTLIILGIACLKSVMAEYEKYLGQIKDRLELRVQERDFSADEHELFAMFLQDVRDKKSIGSFRGRLFAQTERRGGEKSQFNDISMQTVNYLEHKFCT